MKLLFDLQVRSAKSCSGEKLKDAQLHACESAEIHQSAISAQQGLMEMNLLVQVVMDVPAFGAVGLDLPADHRVVVKVRVLVGQSSQIIVVEQIRGVGDAHHQVDVGLDGAIMAFEKIGDHSAEGSDARSGGKKQIVMSCWLRRKNESFSHGSGDLDFIPDLQVAKVIAADSREEIMSCLVVFGGLWPVFIDESFARGSENLAFTVLASCGRGDRIKPDLVGLVVVVHARGDDAERLAGAERTLEGCPRNVDRDVSHEARALPFHAVTTFRDPADHGFHRWHKVHGDIGKNRIMGVFGGFCSHV